MATQIDPAGAAPVSLADAAARLGVDPKDLKSLALDDGVPLSVREAAAALGVTVPTIYNLANREELVLSKILGKTVIFREDFEAFRAKARQGYPVRRRS